MARSRDFLLNIWRGERTDHLHPLLMCLFFLSIIYKGVLTVRAMCFRAGIFSIRKLDRPVVSIGNMTVGGTGKTPAALLLAALFKAKGYRPAILSRGYGGKSSESVHVVSDGWSILSAPESAGDEPFMMAAAAPGIPVVTGADRYASGRHAVERLGADLLILDDAFQHRQLARDVDIVLLNADAPLGNGFVIPRGPLRESPRALKRADCIVLTGTEPETVPVDGLRRIRTGFPGIPVLTAAYRARDLSKNDETVPVESMINKKILAFCGLGNPESFRRSLEKHGAEIVAFVTFPDHFRYTESDVRKIRARAEAANAQMLITTEKDAVKLRAFPDFFREVFILRIRLEVSPAGALEKLIESRIRP